MGRGALWYAARALSDPDDGLSPLAKSTRAAEPWLNAVWQFTGSVIVMVGVGYAVDRFAHTTPWGLIVGGLIGTGVGFYAFIRTSNRLAAEEKAQQQKDAKKP